MKNLQADCFGGTTFHADNGIEAKIKDGIVTIHGKYTVTQFNPMIQMPVYPPPLEKISSSTHLKTVSPNQSSPQWIRLGPPDPLCDDGGGTIKNENIERSTVQPQINAV